VDETEQLNYVLAGVKEEGRPITGVQIQLIQDAELQFGIEKGYYEEE
jgi:predicted HTH transcriptional regulator